MGADLEAGVLQHLADGVAVAVNGLPLAVDVDGDALVHRERRGAAAGER